MFYIYSDQIVNGLPEAAPLIATSLAPPAPFTVTTSSSSSSLLCPFEVDIRRPRPSPTDWEKNRPFLLTIKRRLLGFQALFFLQSFVSSDYITLRRSYVCVLILTPHCPSLSCFLYMGNLHHTVRRESCCYFSCSIFFYLFLHRSRGGYHLQRSLPWPSQPLCDVSCPLFTRCSGRCCHSCSSLDKKLKKKTKA